MKTKCYIAIAVIAASSAMGLHPAEAQTISSVQAPAEFPPSSFTGRQYVDSQGCVFVRAGIDGNITWVPRVARDRKVICGFQPSLGRQVAQAEAPAPAKPAPTPAAAPAKPAPKPAAVAATKPAPKPVVAAQPAQQPVRTTQSQIVQVRPAVVPATAVTTVQPKTVKVVTAQPKPTAKPAKMAPRQSSCRGASAISQKYLRAAPGLEVRCGPQEGSFVSVINGGNGRSVVKAAPVQVASTQTFTQAAPLKRTVTSTAVTPQTRVVPRHVYEGQVISTQGVYIPKGFKTAWDDDRLNPKRAHQNFAGKAQMEVVWTKTVPRILVDRKTGREVAYLYPGLQYPYTSFAQQEAASVTISTRNSGQYTRKATRSKHEVQTSSADLRAQTNVQMRARTQVGGQTKATVSTRSATVRKSVQAASHRYVQAGRFGDADSAQRAAQRLANAGLPTKLGQGRSAGVVIVGPFANQSQVNGALQRVRSMGFGGASLRK